MNSNLVGFPSIIELCLAKKRRRPHLRIEFVPAYGKNTKTSFSIEDRVDKPIALYGATKPTNELIAHYYSHLYGLRFTILYCLRTLGAF